MAKAYYNEFDPYAAQWLRNLVSAGLIAPGDVDERDIRDVKPDDLRGYAQCHFFAGIGGWSAALRQAGWPDERPAWTGSAPCQPFSSAGRQLGFADERHLWPAFHHLIGECDPPVVFGEQVEKAIGHGWLDLIQADLEGIGYAFGAVCVPAAGVGAPHIRQRLWFFAERLANGLGLGRERWEDAQGPAGEEAAQRGEGTPDAQRGCLPVRLAHSDSMRQQQESLAGLRTHAQHDAEPFGVPRGMGNGDHAGLEGQPGHVDGARGRPDSAGSAAEAGAAGGLGDADSERAGRDPRKVRGAQAGEGGRHGSDDADPPGPTSGPGPINGFWGAADWLSCRDGKWRPVEPGTFPLASRVPARVGKLRAYGNAIVPQVASEIIKAYMEVRP